MNLSDAQILILTLPEKAGHLQEHDHTLATTLVLMAQMISPVIAEHNQATIFSWDVLAVVTVYMPKRALTVGGVGGASRHVGTREE